MDTATQHSLPNGAYLYVYRSPAPINEDWNREQTYAIFGFLLSSGVVVLYLVLMLCLFDNEKENESAWLTHVGKVTDADRDHLTQIRKEADDERILQRTRELVQDAASEQAGGLASHELVLLGENERKEVGAGAPAAAEQPEHSEHSAMDPTRRGSKRVQFACAPPPTLDRGAAAGDPTRHNALMPPLPYPADAPPPYVGNRGSCMDDIEQNSTEVTELSCPAEQRAPRTAERGPAQPRADSGAPRSSERTISSASTEENYNANSCAEASCEEASVKSRLHQARNRLNSVSGHVVRHAKDELHKRCGQVQKAATCCGSAVDHIAAPCAHAIDHVPDPDNVVQGAIDASDQALRYSMSAKWSARDLARQTSRQGIQFTAALAAGIESLATTLTDELLASDEELRDAALGMELNELDDESANAGREFLGETSGFGTTEMRRACEYRGQLQINRNTVNAVSELQDH